MRCSADASLLCLQEVLTDFHKLKHVSAPCSQICSCACTQEQQAMPRGVHSGVEAPTAADRPARMPCACRGRRCG